MIEILCSTKSDGNMSSMYSNDGRSNRVKFFNKNNIDYKDAIYLNIKNDNIIFDVNKEIVDKENKYGDLYVDADAIITSNDKFIYCLFGDCVPLVIYDKDKEIISLAHLGWKSVEANLHLKLINYLENNYDSKVEDLEIYLGPSIKKESHKIDIKEEIKQINDNNWKSYIDKDDNYYYIDLIGYIKNTLEIIGIKKIHIDPTDTYDSNLYFSHHKSWVENVGNGRFIYGVRMKRGKIC